MNFITNEKQCIKFTDTRGIDHKTWQKILIQFNHLGYAIPDTDILKKYIESNIYLQKDQSDAVRKVLTASHDKKRYSDERIKNDNQKAIDHFGTTNDPELAGYLLTDGRLLKMSFMNYMRDMDHREIKEVIEIDSQDFQAPLTQFMNYGNIRLMLPHGFELICPPTQEQRNAIIRLTAYFRKNPLIEISIDIANQNGHVIKTFRYKKPTAEEILNNIDNYFKQLET